MGSEMQTEGSQNKRVTGHPGKLTAVQVSLLQLATLHQAIHHQLAQLLLSLLMVMVIWKF